jgi:hypothetical protein
VPRRPDLHAARLEHGLRAGQPRPRGLGRFGRLEVRVPSLTHHPPRGMKMVVAVRAGVCADFCADLARGASRTAGPAFTAGPAARPRRVSRKEAAVLGSVEPPRRIEGLPPNRPRRNEWPLLALGLGRIGPSRASFSSVGPAASGPRLVPFRGAPPHGRSLGCKPSIVQPRRFIYHPIGVDRTASPPT